MSRIIVKNLPKKVSPERLHEVFSSKGQITDLQLKYTKDGVFRQFAFIGFKTIEGAEAAKEYFNNSFFDASRICVESCSDFGDPSKPKAWSKYSKDNSAHKKKLQTKIENEIQEKSTNKKKDKPEVKSKYQEILQEMKNDKDFNEFLELHKSGPNKPVWGNDAGEFAAADDNSENSHTSDEEDNTESETEKKEEKLVCNKINQVTETDDEFTVKLKGLPYKCKKKNIREFFHPLKIVSLRLPPKIKGIAYVKLGTEKAMKQALNKHRSFLSGHKIDVVKYTKRETKPNNEIPDKYADKLKDIDEEVAESGRIFVRNLSYTVTEEELEKLFSSYGTLTEVNLPVDQFTRKVKGFAFVTFMFPEQAMKAFTELDRTSFQGRILHLLPSKQKKVQEEKPSTGTSSYKQKKLTKLKELCGSSHNWNTLFLGANAVAEVLADKYNTTKANLLDAKTSESLAVRMALGETQVVSETRQFLIEHGVELDSFSQPAAERSKTVILVKNLPAKAKAEAIREVFSKFGAIVRIVLPPSGITAIVEFEASSEARNAFNKLSYSKFQHVPLYLEWAPGNVFNSPPKEQSDNTEDVVEEKANARSSADKEKDDNGNTQPVNSTLFVKNLNFTTTEAALKKHFQKAGKIHHVTIATKKDVKNPGSLLSMGFGFIIYEERSSAQTALKTLQHSILDDHKLELKFSNRVTQSLVTKEKSAKVKQKSSKILIRNIPFEATVKEVEELFRVFGELKQVRLPKKLFGTGSHRGFGFVDFVTKNDAKRAFKALCHSTHLYGRRLVLEWANTNDTDVSTIRRKTADNFYKTPSKKKKISIEV